MEVSGQLKAAAIIIAVKERHYFLISTNMSLYEGGIFLNIYPET